MILITSTPLEGTMSDTDGWDEMTEPDPAKSVCVCEEPWGSPGDYCGQCGAQVLNVRTARMLATSARRRDMGNSTVVCAPDHEASLERVRELQAAAEVARYELGQAVKALNVHGVSWTELGDALGVVRQNAHRSYHAVDFGSLPESERERIMRLVGIKPGQAKLEVHRVISGRRGVSKLVTERLSSHIKMSTAMAKAEALAERGERAEVRRVLPDGKVELVAQLGGVRYAGGVLEP